MSQYEGFFGQLAFQTSNFLGRGETFSVSLQQGNRAKNYQVGFTEPFLFDRPITAGVDVFNQEIQYLGAVHAGVGRGMNTVWGFPAGPFSRFFVSYSYQNVQVKDLNPALPDGGDDLGNNPFLADSLLLEQGGERRISKIGPSYVYNTVDNPIFPTTGRRFCARFDLAGLGGNSNFYQPARPRPSGTCSRRHRTSFGFRAATEYIEPYGSTAGAADLREAVPGRRIQHPRLRHPQRRPARSGVGTGHRRQQEPAVQRGVSDLALPDRCASCCLQTPARCATRGSTSRGRRTCHPADHRRAG